MIPQPLTYNLIKQAHDHPSSAHVGVVKMLEYLQRYFYWPKMAVNIRDYVRNCDSCKANKHINYFAKPPKGQIFHVDRPVQRLYLDFLGPYPRSRNGNAYLLIVLDQFTRFVLFNPIKAANTKCTIDFLEDQVFKLFSVPEYIFTDNGKQFTVNLFKKLM